MKATLMPDTQAARGPAAETVSVPESIFPLRMPVPAIGPFPWVPRSDPNFRVTLVYPTAL